MVKSLVCGACFSGSIPEEVFCNNLSLNEREKKLVKVNDFHLKPKA